MPEKQQMDMLSGQQQTTGPVGPIHSNTGLAEVAVKVACRVRPLSNREKVHQHQPCVKISSETKQIVIGKDKQFTFDYVIPPKFNQADLYDECVKGLVNGIFEGYNATVFAYGQTGSGKTHTISGNKASAAEYGIIPRAVNSMFQIINGTSANSPINSHRSTGAVAQNTNNPLNKEYTVKVNFIEIYKEECKDLLDNVEKDLQIREDESGNTIIYGANEIVCNSLEEVMSCFEAGTNQRHVGSTLMNEQSSRSHSVFTLQIEQRWTDPDNKAVRNSSTLYDLNNANNEPNSYYLGAKFHFVDLAGSERANRTGNVGDRFKESVHINSGLLALGNVISALSSGETKKKMHIPYRESKITRILKDSLGGNANTLMICCISPSSCNLDESINCLKYASRARYIKNKPIVNMDSQTQCFVEMQSEIQALRDELQRQRTALVISATGNYDQNLSQNTNHDECNEKCAQLEASLEAAQSETDHYKKLVKEAFSRFKQLRADGNSPRGLIDDWLNMFDALNNKAEFDVEDYAKEKINQLELQLKQAIDDLKSDEEIFADKEKEMNSLKETINDLENKVNTANRYLEAAFNKEREQQELMLQLQIQLDTLMQKNNAHNNAPINPDDSSKNRQNSEFFKKQNITNSSPSNNRDTENNVKNKNRAMTAPNAAGIELLTASQKNEIINEKSMKRTVNSSPALFTLERVMQNFRARSQILAETLEENDNVMQKRNFGSTFDISTDVLTECDENNYNHVADQNDKNAESGNESEEEVSQFSRKGTFKIKKSESKAAELIKKNKNMQSISNKENISQEAQRKLRDLSINVKMKEELIKELVANSKFTNRINLQYQHKIESQQKEIDHLKSEIGDVHHKLTGNNRDMSKTELELKKQVDIYKTKCTDLESKQKNTDKHLNTTMNADKRIGELELALSKMRQQHESLQKKIKDESDKKIKLEKDFEKEQSRLKDLEIHSEKQQKLLKKKTEDLVTAQRRLRSTSANGLNNLNGQGTQSEENLASKQCLDGEVEKILQDKCDLGDQETVSHVLKKIGSIQNDEAKIVKKFVMKMSSLKERELSQIDEINELQQQLSDQNRLVEKLKKSINMDHMTQRSLKSERSNSVINQDQVEYNSKMANMEKEIGYYKEKLNKLNNKSGAAGGYNNRQSENVENSTGISQAAGQSTGSFHLQSTNTNLYSDSIMSMKNIESPSAGDFNSASMQKIKISRKDIRRLTEDEINKRSSSKNF